MARLLVIACLVLVAVVAIQAKPQSKRSQVKALKRALEHEKEKSLAATRKREMQQELMKKKAMAARTMKKAALKRHIEAAKKRQLLESESESEGSGSSSEWSFSDIELSDWEWPESWGEPPSWMPDSWFDKEKEDHEDKPEVKPKDGGKKDKPAHRPRAMKKLALKRHLADAKSKRQEMPPPPPPPSEPEDSEGSGFSSYPSFSDWEWKDSWSSSFDLSEWEWPESWGEPPSWVPDVWLPKPEKEGDKKKAAERLRAMKKSTLKRHLADAKSKRQEMPPPPPPPSEPEDSEGSGSSSYPSFYPSSWEWKDSWSSSSFDLSEWEWPESWGEPPSWVPDVWLPKPKEAKESLRIKALLAAMKKRKLEA